MTKLRRPAVLNVDDRADVRYLRSRALRQAGYDVREASGGQEALDLVAADRPGIVLLDVKLPDMRARAAGFDAHLVKPVDPDQLGRVFAGLGRRPDTAGPAAPDG